MFDYRKNKLCTQAKYKSFNLMKRNPEKREFQGALSRFSGMKFQPTQPGHISPYDQMA